MPLCTRCGEQTETRINLESYGRKGRVCRWCLYELGLAESPYERKAAAE